VNVTVSVSEEDGVDGWYIEETVVWSESRGRMKEVEANEIE